MQNTAEEILSVQDADEVSEPAVTNINTGLHSIEVEYRKQRGLVNVNSNVKTKSVAQILRENVITFFNLVFVILAVLLCIFSDWNDLISTVGRFGFMILVIFNSLIGIVQELRAKRTIDKLSLISAPKAAVLRNGEEQEIPVTDIVLDDITILSTGSQICADAVITEGSIEVNESLITGEPDAISKPVGSHVMSGSFVIAGSAKAQVEHVGADNFANKISEGAKYFKKPNSEIWRSLMLIVKIMAIIIVPIGIALFCVKNYLQDTNVSVNANAIGAITSVLGMIPNGLVALTSTVFCVSVIRLAKRNVLAQDMYCVETLARVDVLCLDKTGTITEGSMEVKFTEPLGEHNKQEVLQMVCDVMNAIPDDNATANALRTYASKVSPKSGEAETIIPFSSSRKWSGARFDGVSYVIGAPEFVFRAQGVPEETAAKIAEYASQGFRVMALASSPNAFGDNELPSNLTPESLICITDKIRPEAPDTLRFFKEQGVTIKIISGDNPETVRAVAKRAGLEDCENIIDMSTITTDEELVEAANKYTIFGRVLPDQKLALIKALKAAKHTVAMTGDGVNDVLALKASDCSIAMASGSDAAKNVSSLVLLDSNFASMPQVVAEGRRSINNLERSAALYLTKTIYNTLLAILFMIVSHQLPFSPQNLTLMGAVTIGIPSLVLALEPNNSRVEGKFLPKVLANSLPGGITVLVGAIAVLICHNYILTSITAEQTCTLFIIITTLVGFMLLAKVCLPFTWIHLALYLFMMFIFIGCYAIPFPKDIVAEFLELNRDFTWDMGKALLSIAAILVPVFVGLSLIMHVVKKRFGKFWENEFEHLDDKIREKDKASEENK